MTDINPDTPDKPIEVPTSPTGTQAGTGIRDILLLVAGLPALIAIFGTHDVMQIVAWFAGQQGLSYIGLVLSIGVPVWRQWIARRKHANEVKMAQAAPDSVATIKP